MKQRYFLDRYQKYFGKDSLQIKTDRFENRTELIVNLNYVIDQVYSSGLKSKVIVESFDQASIPIRKFESVLNGVMKGNILFGEIEINFPNIRNISRNLRMELVELNRIGFVVSFENRFYISSPNSINLFNLVINKVSL